MYTSSPDTLYFSSCESPYKSSVQWCHEDGCMSLNHILDYASVTVYCFKSVILCPKGVVSMMIISKTVICCTVFSYRIWFRQLKNLVHMSPLFDLGRHEYICDRSTKRYGFARRCGYNGILFHFFTFQITTPINLSKIACYTLCSVTACFCI